MLGRLQRRLRLMVAQAISFTMPREFTVIRCLMTRTLDIRREPLAIRFHSPTAPSDDYNLVVQEDTLPTSKPLISQHLTQDVQNVDIHQTLVCVLGAK